MKRYFVFALFITVFTPSLFATEDRTVDPKPLVQLAPGETLTEIHPEKIATVEKIIDLPRIVSNANKLKEAIGIETLAGIVTPVIGVESSVPASASLKLGISPNCDCAKLKLFRIYSAEEGRKPEEISYDAVRGFSADNKTVAVDLEISLDSKLHLRVAAPKDLAPGKFLEWMPASEIKLKPEEKKVSEAAVQKEKAVNKILQNVK